jgi:selenocysteine lyase/cysteine desulfurase
MTALLPCQRDLFDIPREIAWLNCAYMSPLSRAAAAAGEAGLRRKAHPWSISPPDFFERAEEARGLFARLVNADAEGVAIVPAASYGVAVAAANLPVAAGGRIVMLQDQFPSNVHSWRDLAARSGAEAVAVKLPSQGDATAAVLAAIDERCAIAALPNVLWTTGALLDLAAIGARCRAVGAALALDLTQSAGAMPTDFAAIRPDFAVAAAYKWLMGPYAVGFLYVAPRWREGRALEENWINRAGSEDFAGLVDYCDAYQPGARRFDMGERANFALMPAAAAAMRQLIDWTPEAIAATLGAYTPDIARRAQALGLTATPDALRGPHYLSLALPESAPADLPARLAAQGVHVSRRGRSLRVTPHLYNDAEDADRFVAALAASL